MGFPNPAPLPLTVPDLVCVDDLDPGAAETTSDLQTLAQDVYHILLEVLGSNLDDGKRGIGIKNFLNASTFKLAAASSIIDSQLRKDDRIDSSKTLLTLNADGSYSITISLVADGTVIPLSYRYSNQTGLVVNP